MLPPVICALVNWIVIRGKLNRPALQMLKNEQKSQPMKQIKLGKMNFVRAFRIRQIMREARTSFTVVGGMFISLLILMLGLNCFCMCQHISKDNKADTKFEYLYTYKYPKDSVPEGGYEAFTKTVKKENMGYNLEVAILGIEGDNPFFDVKLTDSKSDVVISSAMAEKYGLKKGDVFVVEDEDYYNQVFSDKELDIPTGRLYGVTTKKDIEKSADVFIQQMMPMVVMMTVVSSLIFAVGAAICIPLAKKCMDLMYPLMVSNVSCGMNLHYPWQMYAIVYVAVLVLYFVINGLLTKKLNRVNLAEVLKNRE